VGLLAAPEGAARPSRCEPGRWLVARGVVLVPGASAPARDVLVTTGETVEILSGCPASRLRQRILRRGTKLKAVLRGCTGFVGAARLMGRIDTACSGMRGVFRARQDGVRTAFDADRSACGDGVFDPDAGEACDAGQGCSADACVQCRCGVTTTTTSTSLTTTTCVPVAPTVPALRVVPVNPTATSFAPFAVQAPGSDDWYVVEQRGRIRIVRNGVVVEPPFLDIEAAMGTSPGERGLLSVAFHPSYAVNGRFFTMGTPSVASDGTYAPVNADAVVEWMRDPTNPDRAVPTKVRDVVVLPTSDDNHNGGTILFGPDGYLYVGTGDGGGGCESAKPGAVQDPTKLFGKILRLDVDGTPPFAAPGNPFVDDPRVYHYGLRNPFRLNFNPVTNDLFIGDVGQDAYEEISVAPGNAAAQNFGWPAFEGGVQGTCGPKPLGGPSPHTPPIVTIDRRGGSTGPFADYTSIVGGRVYRGAAIPALQGVYLFADFTGTALGAVTYCDGAVSAPVAVPLSQIETPTGSLSAISSFVEGHDGELYVTYGAPSRIGRLAPQ
jgi:glucose/arabinose dehydrogenase